MLANIYGSYTFSKDGVGGFLNGLTFGANMHGESVSDQRIPCSPRPPECW